MSTHLLVTSVMVKGTDRNRCFEVLGEFSPFGGSLFKFTDLPADIQEALRRWMEGE